MSYTNVKDKIDRLEEVGYLNRGDDSVEYMTKNPFIISRFFNDNTSTEGQKYFKQKLKEYLIEEKVLFQLNYSLLILPDFALSNIINGANSYSEMAFKLNKLEFVRVTSVKDDFVKIQFISQEQRLLFNAQNLQFILDEGITAENGDRNDIIIKSRKCDGVNEKKQIDALFK